MSIAIVATSWVGTVANASPSIVASARVSIVASARVLFVANARVLLVANARVLLVANARVLLVANARVLLVANARVLLVAEGHDRRGVKGGTVLVSGPGTAAAGSGRRNPAGRVLSDPPIAIVADARVVTIVADTRADRKHCLRRGES